jgi:hypothetical protein
MPCVIKIKHTENNANWAGATNEKYPAPDWKANVNITVDIDGLMMFDKAAIPREAEVEHNIGGFKTGMFPDKKTGGSKLMAMGPETEAFNKKAMPPAPAMAVLGAKHLKPIDHENQARTSPVNLGTSHEQLAKDALGIDRNVGKGQQMPDKASFIGFTIQKWEGSEVWPHEIIYRSGTFNMRFSDAGKGIPSDWALLIQKALQELLPDQPVQTRSRAR